MNRHVSTKYKHACALTFSSASLTSPSLPSAELSILRSAFLIRLCSIARSKFPAVAVTATSAAAFKGEGNCGLGDGVAAPTADDVCLNLPMGVNAEPRTPTTMPAMSFLYASLADSLVMPSVLPADFQASHFERPSKLIIEGREPGGKGPTVAHLYMPGLGRGG